MHIAFCKIWSSRWRSLFLIVFSMSKNERSTFVPQLFALNFALRVLLCSRGPYIPRALSTDEAAQSTWWTCDASKMLDSYCGLSCFGLDLHTAHSVPIVNRQQVSPMYFAATRLLMVNPVFPAYHLHLFGVCPQPQMSSSVLSNESVKHDERKNPQYILSLW